jgi:dihydrofolate reductase
LRKTDDSLPVKSVEGRRDLLASVAPKQDEHLTFTFVTGGVESAVSQARTAARDEAVQTVGGVSIAQQLLGAGLVDELHVDIMPVFLGTGLRSFESSRGRRPRLLYLPRAR